MHLQDAQNQLNSSIRSWDTAGFGVPWTKRTSSFLTKPTQIIFEVNFNFPKIVSWYKKSAQSPIHSWDTAEFRVQWTWHILETYDLWDCTQFWPSSSNNSPLEFLQYLENIYINWQYTFSSRETYGLFDCEPCQSVFIVQKLRAK